MQKLLTKFQKRGISGLVRKMLQGAAKPMGIFFDRLEANRQLKGNGNEVVFINEGNIVVKTPAVSSAQCFGKANSVPVQTLEFASRPNKEALLRSIIHDLFEQGYLSKNQSIIDIGCWLSDNTLVWGMLLENVAVVHAIDPSESNINFGKTISAYNGIDNINWVQAVCSDKSGIALNLHGKVDHGSYSEADASNEGTFISTTLDQIVEQSGYSSISLIHVDVEGFEEKVLRGAQRIIEESRPAILFEQHIATEDVSSILNWMNEQDYSVYMINEILPGCNLDCRNFIAFDRRRDLPTLSPQLNALPPERGAWYASYGEGALVPVG